MAKGHPEDSTFKNVNTPQLFSLQGRTIIVTGATGGMGLQVVRALLESGADVIAVDRGATPTVSAWDDLEALAKTHARHLAYHACDVSDSATTHAVFETATAAAPSPLRGLVNCAGVGWIKPSIDFPIDEAKAILDVNLIGTLVVAQAAAKIVRRQGGDYAASFVFIASMSGYVVNKGTPNAAYAASKAGVQQLTRNLASEWGGLARQRDGLPPIRVNSVSPGVIRTPMTAGVLADGDNAKVWTDETMLRRLAEPEDFRGPVVFLLADASAYMTGADVLVDGGYTAW